MAGKQLGIRITDEEFDVLTARIKEIEAETPEVRGKVTEGKIAAYGLKQYIKSLKENSLSVNEIK